MNLYLEAMKIYHLKVKLYAQYSALSNALMIHKKQLTDLKYINALLMKNSNCDGFIFCKKNQRLDVNEILNII